eukprot:scaffold67912_cov26-Tisochrysis_lutea.AAC.1
MNVGERGRESTRMELERSSTWSREKRRARVGFFCQTEEKQGERERERGTNISTRLCGERAQNGGGREGGRGREKERESEEEVGLWRARRA